MIFIDYSGWFFLTFIWYNKFGIKFYIKEKKELFMYKFKGRDIHDFSKGDGKCFVLPNGLGGYSSHSLIN